MRVLLHLSIAVGKSLFMIACSMAAFFFFEEGLRRDSKRNDLGEIPRNSIHTNLACTVFLVFFGVSIGAIYSVLLSFELLKLQATFHLSVLHLSPGWTSSIVLFVVGSLFGDFLNYWLHRAFHSFPLLWPIHRVHHSDEYVNVTSAARAHWLETLAIQTVQALPVLFLSLSPATIVFLQLFETIRNYFTHLAGPMPMGRLGFIFVTPDNHRLHHSIDPQDFNRNFSTTWAIWDHIFGTYRAPDGRFRVTGADVTHSPTSLLKDELNPLRLWNPSPNRPLDPTG